MTRNLYACERCGTAVVKTCRRRLPATCPACSGQNGYDLIREGVDE